MSKEQLIFGQPKAGGSNRLIHHKHRQVAVLNGDTTGILAGGSTGGINWSEDGITDNRADYGRFADLSLPGSIWFREEGYYLVVVNFRLVFVAPVTTGDFKAQGANSLNTGTQLGWVADIQVPMVGMTTAAINLPGGDWFGNEDYYFLQLSNNTDQDVTVYMRAFVSKEG